MRSEPKRTVTLSIVAAGLIAVLALGGWMWAARRGGDHTAGDTHDAIQSIRINGKEVSDIDTKKLMADAASRRSAMLDEFFRLKPGKERNDYLDRMIEQQEEVRKMVGDPTTQPAGTSVTHSKDAKGDTRVMVRAKMDPKMATEGMPPGDRARLAELAAALNARRAERGLPATGGVMMMTMKVQQGSPAPAK
jgi:hypothetical protein